MEGVLNDLPMNTPERLPMISGSRSGRYPAREIGVPSSSVGIEASASPALSSDACPPYDHVRRRPPPPATET